MMINWSAVELFLIGFTSGWRSRGDRGRGGEDGSREGLGSLGYEGSVVVVRGCCDRVWGVLLEGGNGQTTLLQSFDCNLEKIILIQKADSKTVNRSI